MSDANDWQRDDNERRARERAARDEGIERAYAAAYEAWKVHAFRAVDWCAREYRTFISDAVWDRLEVLTPFKPREKRCIAGVLLRAKALGWIASTGGRENSLQAGVHLNEVMVWRSLIYNPGPREPSQQELSL